MKKQKFGLGSGVYSDNDISRDISHGVKKSHFNVTTLNNAWRKAKKENPDLVFSMTFVQWKKKFINQWYKNKRKGLKSK
jgi:capsule polysaccharide export protein KpsC/LpsZ